MNTITMSSVRTEVAKRIRMIAAEKFLKPRDVAEATGMNQARVSRIFHAHVSPTVDELADIAFALDTNIGNLLPVTVPDEEPARQDIEARVNRLHREVDAIAHALLEQDVAGARQIDWPKWAAAAAALRLADQLLAFVGRPSQVGEWIADVLAAEDAAS